MPQLKRLTIRGYKSIRTLEDFELRSLNVLIGANGAGKSNFISIFRMLAELAEQRLQLYVREQDGPDALLFGTRKRTMQILSPEHINDGFDTHPSARLKLLNPRFEKVLHGPAAAARIGIERMRSECRHFAAWLARIETLKSL